MKFLIVNLLQDGGPAFTYPMLLMLIVCIVLILKGFIKGDPDGKTKKLISHISLFALVWGFLGQLIALIGTFDSIQAAGDISPSILASGLKIALLSPTFGMVVFLFGRAGIILLSVLKK